jgi:hypothetical protein
MLKSLITLFICLELVLSTDISACGKYQCQSAGKNETCVYIAAGPKRRVDHDEITLFDVCKDSEFCDIPAGIDGLSVQTDDTTFECEPVDFIKTRYPGEDCDQDDDCAWDGKCDQTAKKCVGSKEGEQCDGHEDCWVGLYCDNASSTCTKQKSRGDACSDSIECENAIFCYNSTCSVTPFSLPIGVVVPDDDEGQYVYSMEFCNRMWADKDDQGRIVCTSITQTVPEGEEYIKCNLGDRCHYKILETQDFNLDCECGANADGQGYCPQGQNLSKYIL